MNGPVAPRYEHTQKGTDVMVILALAIALVAVVGISLLALTSGETLPIWLPIGITVGVMSVTLVIFTSLTVRVDDRELRWHFGFGWPSFRLPLAEITAARIVKNSRLLGYGIRVIRRGMLYNVSGTSAVEIVRPNDSVIRIGTDEPEALLAAIESARQA